MGEGGRVGGMGGGKVGGGEREKEKKRWSEGCESVYGGVWGHSRERGLEGSEEGVWTETPPKAK